jgi:hypothetical protein
MRIFYLYTACCMPCTSNAPWFDHSRNILRRPPSMLLQITQFSQALRLLHRCLPCHSARDPVQRACSALRAPGKSARLYIPMGKSYGFCTPYFNLYISEQQPGRRGSVQTRQTFWHSLLLLIPLCMYLL